MKKFTFLSFMIEFLLHFYLNGTNAPKKFIHHAKFLFKFVDSVEFRREMEIIFLIK